MSTDVMKQGNTETSPQVYARLGGVLYLIIIVIGFCSEFFVRDKLVVTGDVTATANNIVASESLWRVTIAGELILLVCGVALTLILYVLLRPVNKHLALLAVLFNIVEFPIEAVSKLCLFGALFLSGNADYLKALEPHQLHALVQVSLKLHDYGFGIDLVFFGCACLVYGYLLYKSGYFPRTIGVLMAIAGLSYLVNSFTLIVAPAYAGKIFLILVLALVGELSLCLWLMVKGVNLPKWNEKARLSSG
ncbi:MAG TPA: DUF4386 domain-containing protein [Candidatus Dormibacteraeota bacterium]|nr:DUF4386 domain-containing protein [Candidatus Dormibacteraeota bacterium]